MNPKLEFIKEKECWVVRADNGKSIEGFRNLGVAGLHFDIYELPNDGVKVFENKERTKEIFQKYSHRAFRWQAKEGLLVC